MEFDNSFEVPLPPAEAWKVLLDIRGIAPCMPGAELSEVVSADTYKGKINVRLGPVALTFAGLVKFDQIDEAHHTARVSAQGTDAKGRGGAHATSVFRLEPAANGSKVIVHTNLESLRSSRAIRPRCRHHPGHIRAADESVRQGAAGKVRTKRHSAGRRAGSSSRPNAPRATRSGVREPGCNRLASSCRS